MNRNRQARGGRENIPETQRMEETVRILKNVITTSPDLVRTLNRINIPLLDDEELISEEEEQQEELTGEDDEGLTDEEYGVEDENIDFDENEPTDPFDIEEDEPFGSARYVVKVDIENETPVVKMIEGPAFLLEKGNSFSQLVKDALLKRHFILSEMALFIAEKQKEFFKNPSLELKPRLTGLNQADLVNHLKSKPRNWYFLNPLQRRGKMSGLRKEHVSNLLGTLYFKIDGVGEIPAAFFFERRGSKGFTKAQVLALARQFLKLQNNYTSTTEEAKSFHEYIKDQTGVKIQIPVRGRDEDRYRLLRNWLREAKKKNDGTN